ncbi:MAG: hypothetical protein QOG53_2652 [Frankiales bacterium]|jgi:erythromycin esterase-like protein/predicted phosphoribosyltransferase|nr:hypothetical protein [Frankiales bacterium]
MTATSTAPGSRTFRDRREAGRVLAQQLARYRGRRDVIVLALPRGGVPVGYEIATAVEAPLDVFVVRKLGVPGNEELAMGAIASGGIATINEDVVRGLEISPDTIQQVAESEARELLRREQAYREGRSSLPIGGQTVILVDDGLATGASMHAAILALQQHGPARIVVAVPAAPESTCQELRALVDEVVCATTPSPFFAVGASYWDFAQTTDDEVRGLLREATTVRREATVARFPTELATVRAAIATVDEGAMYDDELFDLVGNAHVVLIGEASHGTHEFYAARARMTRRLIEEKGFAAVAIEGDWPDAFRVNRYVRGHGEDKTAEESLRGFERFPSWMWRNEVVLDFVGWLRHHNDRIGRDDRATAGFYGLDVYSLFRSQSEVISYLERVDPAAAAQARERYSCFDHPGASDDGQAYGYAAAFGAGPTCEAEAVAQLVDIQEHAADYVSRGGRLLPEDHFFAEQNARVVKNAEAYYRAMFSGRTSSWNLRDQHMSETLDALISHLGEQRQEPAKIVVWAHNSHVGDARVTEAAARGELTLGQLVRQGRPDDCRLIGFTTYAGAVTAAHDWGGPAERKRVRPALDNSVEDFFHDVGDESFLLRFDRPAPATELLRIPRLERAIGVIYRPRTERQSHYFSTRLAEQFDAVIHIDETRAVEPLERTAMWETGEPPETYPFAV